MGPMESHWISTANWFCDVLGLEPGICFKVGLKCRRWLDAGVAGVVWTDWAGRGSFEEGRVGWRRGMKDTVVQLGGVDAEDGKDDSPHDAHHGL